MAAFLSLPRNFKVSHTTHYSLLTTQVWGRCALPSVHRTPSIQILELLVEVWGPSEPWLLTFDDCIVRRWKWWSPWWWLHNTRMIMMANYIYTMRHFFHRWTLDKPILGVGHQILKCITPLLWVFWGGVVHCCAVSDTPSGQNISGFAQREDMYARLLREPWQCDPIQSDDNFYPDLKQVQLTLQV